eukprot:TRINITY_DN40566_c0_g1_i1.p1 TRINITY_DN40566_c0_g1~~TRINITY_DN40566_c0_g1_i1.p1  ORF type:complete len:482 (+),score=85.24 TRINITY_DN40566_c0_g1_i1:33-1478(+)
MSFTFTTVPVQRPVCNATAASAAADAALSVATSSRSAEFCSSGAESPTVGGGLCHRVQRRRRLHELKETLCIRASSATDPVLRLALFRAHAAVPPLARLSSSAPAAPNEATDDRFSESQQKSEVQTVGHPGAPTSPSVLRSSVRKASLGTTPVSLSCVGGSSPVRSVACVRSPGGHRVSRDGGGGNRSASHSPRLQSAAPTRGVPSESAGSPRMKARRASAVASMVAVARGTAPAVAALAKDLDELLSGLLAPAADAVGTAFGRLLCELHALEQRAISQAKVGEELATSLKIQPPLDRMQQRLREAERVYQTYVESFPYSQQSLSERNAEASRQTRMSKDGMKDTQAELLFLRAERQELQRQERAADAMLAATAAESSAKAMLDAAGLASDYPERSALMPSVAVRLTSSESAKNGAIAESESGIARVRRQLQADYTELKSLQERIEMLEKEVSKFEKVLEANGTMKGKLASLRASKSGQSS